MAQSPEERSALIESINIKLEGNPDKYQILATINCESGFQSIQSNIMNKQGKREESYGIVQIHLPSWPEITKEEALDPVFALDFIVKQFKAGHKRYWTCWRMLAYNR